MDLSDRKVRVPPGLLFTPNMFWNLANFTDKLQFAVNGKCSESSSWQKLTENNFHAAP